MNREDLRLVAVSPAIKSHPLWQGSTLQTDFLYGGLTRGRVKGYIAEKRRCSDLTWNELSFCALLQEALDK